MTLFANIINNPLDAKAKSDARLMGMVVQFLLMLGQEAETGGVHRMLGVCAEFERIAQIVIEKAEKEPRRKRKNVDTPGKAASAAAAHLKPPGTSQTATPSTSSSQTTRPLTSSSSTTTAPASTTPYQVHDGNTLSPPNQQQSSYSPMTGSMQGSSPSMASGGGWQNDYPMPQNGDFDSFVDMNGFGTGGSPSGINIPFQQPLLPQDLFSLPMTLDWNWAELSGGAYPTVENGNFGVDGQQQQPHQ